LQLFTIHRNPPSRVTRPRRDFRRESSSSRPS